MTALKKIFLVFIAVFLPLAAEAVVVQSIGADSTNWAANTDTTLTGNFSLQSNPGNVFSNITFSLVLYADNRPVDKQELTPFGGIRLSTGNDSVFFTTTYLRSGTEIGSGLTYETLTWFLDKNVLVNSATSSTDNYLGVSFLDASSQPHYGWLQFELHPFSDGSLAVKFLAGDVLDVAGIAAQAGTIPEPSAVALLAAAGAGLALAARSRRKSRS